MTPKHFVIPVLLLLFGHCLPHIINPILTSKLFQEGKLEMAANNFLLPFNSSNNLIENNHRARNARRQCTIHAHCRQHEHCGCSYYCQNNYRDCNRRKREADATWSEEKDNEEFTRSQRDCEIRRGDRRPGHICYSHDDCGCNRRCSCHGYCTYIC